LTFLNADLDVPGAVGLLHRYNSSRLWRAFDAILGLNFAQRAVLPKEESAPDDIRELAEARIVARATKNWAEADRLRKVLAEMGWDAADSPAGQTLKKRSWCSRRIGLRRKKAKMSEATKEFLWTRVMPVAGIGLILLTLFVLVSAFIWSRREDAIRQNYYMGKWRRRRWDE